MMQHSESETLNELTAALYRGPFETPRWDSFLNMLMATCDGSAASITLSRPTLDTQGVFFAVSDHTMDMEGYCNYARFNSFVDLPNGEAVTMHQITPKAELEQSPFYKHIMLDRGFKFMLGIDIYKDQHEAITVRVIRRTESEDFGNRERSLLKGLYPHFENLVLWLDKFEELNSERSIYESVISQLALGTVLIGPKGDILRSNPVAEYLLDAGDGLFVEQGRLACRSAALNRELHQLISNVNDERRPRLVDSLTVPRMRERTPLYLTIKPHVTSEFTGDTIAAHNMVFINAAEMQVSGSQEALREMLGLTKAETRVALEMANGLTVNEITEKLHISNNTARTHLSRIYQKTEVNNQTALVNVVLRCIASHNNPSSA